DEARSAYPRLAASLPLPVPMPTSRRPTLVETTTHRPADPHGVPRLVSLARFGRDRVGPDRDGPRSAFPLVGGQLLAPWPSCGGSTPARGRQTPLRRCCPGPRSMATTLASDFGSGNTSSSVVGGATMTTWGLGSGNSVLSSAVAPSVDVGGSF